MRRIPIDNNCHDDPVTVLSTRDYRLLLQVVKQSEPLARLAEQGMVASGMFVGLARALNALNAPRKQK